MLAQEMHLKPENVKNVVELIDEGCTIPFIARYRKERTGSMDDQVLRLLSERLEYLCQLEERKDEIAKTLGEQGVLSAELQKALDAAKTLTEAEDIYRPYRPKRRTRAAIAREKGLSQLAESIKEQTLGNPKFWAKNYVTDEMDEDAALSGALDILAEEISDDAAARKQLREVLQRTAVLHTEAADPEKQSVYTMYYGRRSRWQGCLRTARWPSTAEKRRAFFAFRSRRTMDGWRAFCAAGSLRRAIPAPSSWARPATTRSTA